MIRINVFVDGNHPKKDGSMSVKFRITGNDDRRFFIDTGMSSMYRFTGRAFNPKEKLSGAKTSRLNRLYDQIEEFCLKNPDMPSETLKPALAEIVTGKKQKTKTLADYVSEFAATKTGRTRSLYLGTHKKVEDFDKNATLETVDWKWLTSFDKSLSKTMSVNGKSVHLRNLRAVFNRAIDDEVTKNYPFRKFTIAKERTAKRNLSAKQLREVRDLDCEPWQERWRDMFMLMFYLIGINAVDLFNLKKSDYRNGRITYHRAKTGRLYDIKVEPEAARLIEKYEGKEWLLCCHDEYKNHLDWIHHLNNCLKNLGKKYTNGKKPEGDAIESRMTSYWSRHTWASIAAEIDIPVDVIGHALGHADARVADIYINFSTKKIDDANRKVINYVNK